MAGESNGRLPIVRLTGRKLKNKLEEFLVDSGSDVSIIAKSKVSPKIKINENEIIQLTGIETTESSEDKIFTLGTCNLKLRMGNVIFHHTFQLVDDSFAISALIGLDFLRKFQVHLDFNENLFISHGRATPIYFGYRHRNDDIPRKVKRITFLEEVELHYFEPHQCDSLGNEERNTKSSVPYQNAELAPNSYSYSKSNTDEAPNSVLNINGESKVNSNPNSISINENSMNISASSEIPEITDDEPKNIQSKETKRQKDPPPEASKEEHKPNSGIPQVKNLGVKEGKTDPLTENKSERPKHIDEQKGRSPIKMTIDGTSITLPARSEAFLRCLVSNYKPGMGTVITSEKYCTQPIRPNVYVSKCITKVNEKGEALFSILNCNSHDVELTDITIEVDDVRVSAASVFKLEKVQNSESKRLDQLVELLKLDHLTPSEKKQVLDLCFEFNDVFYVPGDRMKVTDLLEAEVPTIDNVPVAQKNYRLPHGLHEVVENQIQEWLEQDIIQPSTSPYNAPLWCVEKANRDSQGRKQFRVVTDFRKLNAKISGDAYPIPLISEILDQLGKSSFFSTLDLKSGFLHIPIKPSDRHKLAFSTSKGHYEYKSLPFGLKISPNIFQRALNMALMGLVGTSCLLYIDDIIVYSENLPEHMRRLRNVFSCLRKHNFLIEPTKCSLLRREVKFLGHFISGAGIQPDENKVKALRNFPVPRTPKELKSFLGVSGYYRNFIPNYSDICLPLTNLLKKDAKFMWTSVQQRAFEEVKSILTSRPLLQFPQYDIPFNLTTDASLYCIAACLSQGPVGHDRPISFVSRKLNKDEQNWPSVEREALAVVYFMKYFNHFFYNHRVHVFTDCQCITWLFSVTEPNSRLLKWRLTLNSFDYKVFYRTGRGNKVCDALSRYPPEKESDNTEIDVDIELEPQSIAEGIAGKQVINIIKGMDVNNVNSTNDYCEGIIQEYFFDNNANNHSSNEGIPFRVFTITNNEVKESYNEYLERTQGKTFEEMQKEMQSYSQFLAEIQKRPVINSLVEEVNEEFMKSKHPKVLIGSSDLEFHNVELLNEDQRNLLTTKTFQAKDILIVPGDPNFYVVFIKDYHWELTDYENFYKSVQNLRWALHDSDRCISIDARDLKDMKFEKVRMIIRYIFRGTNVKILLHIANIQTPKPSDIPKILAECHSSVMGGHRGVKGTIEKVKRNYTWKNMRTDVENFVRGCHSCNLSKFNRHPQTPAMKISTVADRVFQRIYWDVVGPLPVSSNGSRYILSILDDLTRFLVVIPLTDHTAETIAHAMVTRFVCIFGAPEELLSDNAPEFNSALIKEIRKIFKIKKISITAYHPQANIVERTHQTITEYLRQFVKNDAAEWDQYLELAMFSFNTTKNSSTQYPPYDLVFGTPARQPTSFLNPPPFKYTYDDYTQNLKIRLHTTHQLAKKNIIESKIRNKKYYDKKTSIFKYKAGDYVYLKRENPKSKLDSKFTGPYLVLDVKEPDVTIKVKGKAVKVHAQRIKAAPHFAALSG